MAKIYGNRWKLIDTLGQGGQSIVYCVQDTSRQTDEHFALKRLINPKRSARFKNEIDALSRLGHPNVITLIDYVLDSNSYLVMPVALGGELS